MASAKFLEEALSTDIDESAVSALVGSLENQLVTSTPSSNDQNTVVTGLSQPNHINNNSAIANGGSTTQKHNGNSLENNKVVLQQQTYSDGIKQQQQQQPQQGNDAGVINKVVYSQAMTSSALTNRVSFPNSQTLPNGTIGLSPLTQQTVQLQQQHQQQQQQQSTNKQQQPTIVLKTSNAQGTGGMVTVPMNVTAANLPQVNNVGSNNNNTITTQSPQNNILSNLQVVNVRPGGVVPTQVVGAKGQSGATAARVVLSSAPQIVGARPGTPQLTLQSLQGLQPGQQGHLLLKTENGQFQLLRVGPAPTGVSATNATGQNVTFRMQPVGQTVTTTSIAQPTQVTGTPIATAPTVTTTPAQRPANDNTKEKCRKFLANLLELSSREPKAVERNVRTLIQELIDTRVEPEDFCDRLERLLNASPQPCLIGFLKKSLPLLRHSLATKELTIDGIRPPPANVVFSVASSVVGAPPVTLIQTTGGSLQQQQQQQQQMHQQQSPQVLQTHVIRPGTTMVTTSSAGGVMMTGTPQQVRLVSAAGGTGVGMRPQLVQQQQRMLTTGAPVRTVVGGIQQQVVGGQQRLVRPQQVFTPRTQYQVVNNQPVIVSSSQPPALHPVVFPTQQQQPRPTLTTQQHIQPQPQQQQLQQSQQLQQQQQTIRSTPIITQQQLQLQQQQSNNIAATIATVATGNNNNNNNSGGNSGNNSNNITMVSQHQQLQQQQHHQQQQQQSTVQVRGGVLVNSGTSNNSNSVSSIVSSGVGAGKVFVRTTGGQVRNSHHVNKVNVVGGGGGGVGGMGGVGGGVQGVTGGVKPAVPTMTTATVKHSPAAKVEKKTFSSAYTGDDDINDVAAMGGVNLAEETQRILGSTEFVGTQIRSCKEDFFLSMAPLQLRIRQAMAKYSLDEPQSNDVAAVISHAAQERVKNLVEKLAIITEHRLELVKGDGRYEIRSDVKAQLKFLEELDRAERKRHEEVEREMLLRAAKSRSKTEDPEQAKLKAKAKEMQRVEMEELRQREANATALQAIGPRKKPRLEDATPGTSQSSSSTSSSTPRGQMPLRQRLKKVTLKDLQFMFESEKELCRSTLLYKSYLK